MLASTPIRLERCFHEASPPLLQLSRQKTEDQRRVSAFSVLLEGAANHRDHLGGEDGRRRAGVPARGGQVKQSHKLDLAACSVFVPCRVIRVTALSK